MAVLELGTGLFRARVWGLGLFRGLRLGCLGATGHVKMA